MIKFNHEEAHLPDKINLTVAGEPCEVRAHPDKKTVSIALNTARGCVWRGLVKLDGAMLDVDAINARPIIAAALSKELKTMRVLYGGGGVLVGALTAIILGLVR